MFEPNMLVPKPKRPLLTTPPSPRSAEPKQRRMMVTALTLLLVALGFVLYRDRDFWFPDSASAQDAEALPAQSAPTAVSPPVQPLAATASPPATGSKHRSSEIAKQAKGPAPAAPPSTPPASSPPLTAITQRTVLPPLEVEVVAGNVHRTIHPGANSVRVDLQPGAPSEPISEPSVAANAPATPPSVTNAAEHVQMSADASEIITHPVKPGYPMLARQMKVQGSVILQALISRDGAIQDLHVVSGPPILAGAAREAVRQWRFKPHYLGAETVETQAKITVNFTISTN